VIWLAEWWTFVIGATVLFAPGAIAGVIVGLRGFTAAAAAAPLSLAALGAASLVGIAIPFPWGPVARAVVALALIAVALGVRAIARRWDAAEPRETAPPRSWATWLPFAAVALAAALLVPRLLVVFIDPQNISQTFDNVYHLNAVRYILDTGAIAPTRQLIPGFYPSLWHTLTATVASLSGATIPASVNVVSILLAAIVWPMSCVFLTRQIVGDSTPALLAAGALSAGLGAFPLLMLDFGVLYPNVLSIALLPAVLAALVTVTGLGAGPRPGRIVRWVVLLAFVPTLALAHPSTLMAFFGIGFWPALAGLIVWVRAERGKEGSRTRLRWGVTVWIAGAVVAALLFGFARPTRDQAFWGPSTTPWDASVHVLLNGWVFRPVDYVSAGLMLAGVVSILVWRRRWWWLVAGWATLWVIYVVGASVPRGLLRYVLTGTWYSDLFRVGALFPSVVVPLGAIGFAAVIGLVAAGVRRAGPKWRAVTPVATAAGVAAIVALTQTGTAMTSATINAQRMYVISPSSPLLTTYERDLIGRLDQIVPSGDVIAGSPWTGTSLTFALADRPALLQHIYADLDAERPADVALILESLNTAATDPEVCEAVERTHARWVLDFGAHEIHSGQHVYPGLTGLVEAGVAELVDSEGPDARLYRVTACD